MRVSPSPVLPANDLNVRVAPPKAFVIAAAAYYVNVSFSPSNNLQYIPNCHVVYEKVSECISLQSPYYTHKKNLNNSAYWLMESNYCMYM